MFIMICGTFAIFTFIVGSTMPTALLIGFPYPGLTGFGCSISRVTMVTEERE
jgi:hypothetical protein